MAAAPFSVQLVGQFRQARRRLGPVGRSMLAKAFRKATRQEAQFFRAELIKGLTSGAPGGKRFAPLSELTIDTRRAAGFRGRKPLLRTGALRRSIVVRSSRDEAFVGILRTAKGPDGKSLVNIAQIMEEGTVVVVRVTPRMKRFFFAMLRQAGAEPSPGGGGFSRGVLVIQIPARPFFGPVFEKLAKPRVKVAIRMLRRVAVLTAGQYGKV